MTTSRKKPEIEIDHIESTWSYVEFTGEEREFSGTFYEPAGRGAGYALDWYEETPDDWEDIETEVLSKI